VKKRGKQWNIQLIPVRENNSRIAVAGSILLKSHLPAGTSGWFNKQTCTDHMAKSQKQV
jgi:hypothetical protein